MVVIAPPPDIPGAWARKLLAVAMVFAAVVQIFACPPSIVVTFPVDWASTSMLHAITFVAVAVPWCEARAWTAPDLVNLRPVAPRPLPPRGGPEDRGQSPPPGLWFA